MNSGRPHSWWSEYLKNKWRKHRPEMLEICQHGGQASGRFHGKHTDETKRKISEKMKQKGCHPPWELSPCSKKGYRREDIVGKEVAERIRQAIIAYNEDRVVSQESRIKMSEAKRGERNPGWKGGVKTEREQIRNGFEIKAWKLAVFKRDNYMCQYCRVIGNGLHAHHLKEFASYPELRFDVNNGITLCVECHKNTPSYGGRWKR